VTSCASERRNQSGGYVIPPWLTSHLVLTANSDGGWRPSGGVRANEGHCER
jgi:hypothetical protein